ncbi:glycine cleavage system protein H [Lignipirellula cremea]|uniref:Glycine cleavage system H protein n=1 Tax=Lignipirellula cremea TaxID=2528010 RepID=A0A518E2H3_9BACT|nr:glycine cleavage system protein H [Lignipirellula cremea]QDU98286.1 Glycine cleavage system H protein [Lignipirellula cremea]
MSDSLVFMMGEFEATFPTDRKYAKNHMWAQPQGDTYRFGFSAYAVRLLQDVYFLDWSIDAPVALRERMEIGSIESKKAESDLYAPVSGQLTTFNEELLSDPSAINVDKYNAGWLFEIAQVELNDQGAPLLSPEEYLKHLEQVWEVTQRTIKGQMNQ